MAKKKGKGKKESVGSASEQAKNKALTELSQADTPNQIEETSEGSVKAGSNSAGQEGTKDKNVEEESGAEKIDEEDVMEKHMAEKIAEVDTKEKGRAEKIAEEDAKEECRAEKVAEEDAKEEHRTEKVAEEDVKEKRKAEDENLDIVETPPKRRTVVQKKVDASMSSNEKSSPYNFRTKRAIPCFRNIDLSESEFKGAVGKKVKVLPTGSKKWITGVIESYNAKKKHHKVVYDDGLISELDLTKECFELEVKPGEAYTSKGSSSGKGKKIKVDDNDETEKKKASKAEKGKAIATETSEELSDAEPVDKAIKLGESPRARRAAKEIADAVAEAKTAPSKTKKKRARKGRKKVRTRK